MKMSLTKTFTFAAAHKLPNYQGLCRNLHGHEWRLDITVEGEVNKQTGMVVDFVHFKGIVDHEIIHKLDHTYLNDLIPYPTAELILNWIAINLPQHLILMGVKLIKMEL